MKGLGLVQCYLLWTDQSYYSQVLDFTKKFGTLNVDQAFFVKANTCVVF